MYFVTKHHWKMEVDGNSCGDSEWEKKDIMYCIICMFHGHHHSHSPFSLFIYLEAHCMLPLAKPDTTKDHMTRTYNYTKH